MSLHRKFSLSLCVKRVDGSKPCPIEGTHERPSLPSSKDYPGLPVDVPPPPRLSSLYGSSVILHRAFSRVDPSIHAHSERSTVNLVRGNVNFSWSVLDYAAKKMKSEFHAFTYSIEIVLHYTPVLGEKGGGRWNLPEIRGRSNEGSSWRFVRAKFVTRNHNPPVVRSNFPVFREFYFLRAQFPYMKKFQSCSRFSYFPYI